MDRKWDGLFHVEALCPQDAMKKVGAPCGFPRNALARWRGGEFLLRGRNEDSRSTQHPEKPVAQNRGKPASG